MPAKAKKKTEPAKPLYLVCGNDEYEVSNHVRALVNRLCPDEEQALSLETIDGAADNTAEAVEAIKQCVEALCTVGLFGGKKVVWLRDANFFTDNAVGKTQDTKERVKQFAELLIFGSTHPSLTLI